MDRGVTHVQPMKNRKENPTTRGALISTAARHSCCFAGILAGSAALLPSVRAADIQWTGTTGTFNDPANWAGGAIPGGADFAWVGNGGTVQIGAADPIWVTQDFRMGAGGPTGLMEQSGGIANVTSWFRMGVDSGSTGTYTMTGGILNIRNGRINVGEKGSGVLNVSGGLIVHNSGQIIVGDRNNGADSSAISSGVINQSGGVFTNEAEIWLGFGVAGDNTDFGTMNLTGGTFNIRRWTIIGRTGGEGVLNVSGADTLFAKSGEDGSFIVGSADGGTNTKGTVNQTSGTVAIGSEGWIGRDATSLGTYNLSGGAININNIWAVGRSGGSGVFNMTGGTLTKTGGGSFVVAREGSPSGVVNHSGGLVSIVDGELHVGESTATIQGNGTYNLSGTGEVRVSNVSVSRNLNSQGTVNLDGGSLRTGRLFKNTTDVGSMGAINFNGTQITAIRNEANFISGLNTAEVKAGGLKLDTDTYSVATAQVFTGAGGITKTGLGSFTLSGGFAPTGATTVSGGTLAIAGASPVTFAGSSLTVSDGAALSGDNVTISGTTEVAASGGVLLANATSTTPIAFGGAVNLNGPTRIDFSNAVVAPGTYKVATYTGSVTGDTNLSLGRPGSISLLTPGEINVTVDPVRALTWTGAANSTWDIFSAVNWDNAGAGAAFGQGDSVTLDDVAGTAPINVTGPIRPAAVTFNNTAGNTITLQAGHGSAQITGTVALSKQGDGKAILDLDATLATGSTVAITGGELQVGNGGTTGSLGLATIANAGTLHFNLNRDRIVTNAITGTGNFVKSGTGNVTLNAGFASATTTVNSGRLTLVTPAVLTGATTIGAGAELEARLTSNQDSYTGQLSGSGKLIKTGGSELFLNADNSAFTGDIELRRGPGNSVNIRNVNALGSPAGKTVVYGLNNGTSQSLNIRNLGAGSPFTLAEPIELRANAFGRAGITHEAGGDSTQVVNLTGSITLSSSARAGVHFRNYNRTGTMNIMGDITGKMAGAPIFVRSNTNANTGGINILGSLNIEDDAELVLTEEIRVRLGSAGKTYDNFRTTIANGHLRTLVDNAMPADQPLFLGEGNNGVDSKLILGDGTTAVSQTVNGIGSNNTDPDCRIVGGATTNSTLTMDLRGNSTLAAPFGGVGTNENNLNIVKANIGTLTLTGASTHAGTTTVTGGTLLANANIGPSAVTVEAGATVGGTGTLGSLAASGTAGSTANIAPGNNGVGTLAVAGAANLGTDSAVNWQITNWTGAAGAGYDLLNITGALTLSATPANPAVIRISGINPPVDNFAEALTSFDFVTAAGGITGFDVAAITLDDSGFTGAGTWSISQVGNSLRLTYSGTPYGNWAASKGLTGEAALPDADPDGDGIANSVEFVLGTEPNPANPDSMSVADLPDQTLDATHLTVVYRLADVAVSAAPVIEYGSELTGWTDAVNGVDGVIIDPPVDMGAFDEITVKIPRGDNDKLFARLKVTITP